MIKFITVTSVSYSVSDYELESFKPNLNFGCNKDKPYSIKNSLLVLLPLMSCKQTALLTTQSC